MILISIVTITYNAARSLQRTLDSVSCQSYPHLEHLIVDGASKDETLQMARHYQEASPYEVVVSSEPDKGLYDAMNKGRYDTDGGQCRQLSALIRQFSAPPSRCLWRYCHYRCRGTFPSSAPSAPSQGVVMAFVPSGHAGVSSGLLCPFGHCPTDTL